MQKVVDQYLNHAIQLIEGKQGGTEVIDAKHRMSQDGSAVDSEFRGYISAFGASLIQAGLIPTLAFYADREANSAKDRWKILIVLYHLLKGKAQWKDRLTEMKEQKEEQKLLRLALALQPTELRRLQQDIINAAIALKLALRTYLLTDKSTQHG
jgi:CRISPR-associated protein Cmr5